MQNDRHLAPEVARRAELGTWDVPESELNLLPADMSGIDAIELGCGTGYVSAWMARRGASVVGIDLSAGQLATAERLAADHQIELRLLRGNAEEVPRPDASFDFAISEYGTVLWCDPYRWVPEAHRLLRPGGTLVTLCSSSLWLFDDTGFDVLDFIEVQAPADATGERFGVPAGRGDAGAGRPSLDLRVAMAVGGVR